MNWEDEPDESFESKTTDEKIAFLNKNLNNIFSIKKISSLFKNNLNSLDPIYKLYRDQGLFFKFDDDLKKRLIYFSIDFLDFLLKELSNVKDASSEMILKLIENFEYLGVILLYATNSSEAVSIMYHQCPKNGIKILVTLLTTSIQNIETFLADRADYIIEIILGCLNNLSIVSYNFKSIWLELGEISIYYEWSKKFGQVNTACKILPYFIIANIASDENLKNMSDDVGHIIQEIVLKVEYISNQLKNQNLLRSKMYLEQKLVNIIGDSSGFNLNEVII